MRVLHNAWENQVCRTCESAVTTVRAVGDAACTIPAAWSSPILRDRPGMAAWCSPTRGGSPAAAGGGRAAWCSARTEPLVITVAVAGPVAVAGAAGSDVGQAVASRCPVRAVATSISSAAEAPHTHDHYGSSRLRPK